MSTFLDKAIDAKEAKVYTRSEYNKLLDRLQKAYDDHEHLVYLSNLQVGDKVENSRISFYSTNSFDIIVIKRTKTGHLTFDILEKESGKFRTRETISRKDFDIKIDSRLREIEIAERLIDKVQWINEDEETNK